MRKFNPPKKQNNYLLIIDFILFMIALTIIKIYKIKLVFFLNGGLEKGWVKTPPVP